MNNFQRNIYRIETATNEEVPYITADSEISVTCNGQVKTTVFTTIPVKINISGIFELGGSWLDLADLIGGAGVIKVSSPGITGTVISETTAFNYGINGANSGTLLNTSSITIDIINIDTEAIINSYTYSRLHADTQC